MSNLLREFAHAYRFRYQLARGFCQIPRHRAARNALRGALDEIACDTISGHDFSLIDGQIRCDICATVRETA